MPNEKYDKLFKSTKELSGIIKRMEIEEDVIKRFVEEEITEIVSVESKIIAQAEQNLLGGTSKDCWLQQRGWSESDLLMHIKRPIALELFGKKQFGNSIEEKFLATQGNRDIITYSMIRFKDAGLAREVYLRLVENELTFPDAATRYGEGPEAERKGVIGPMQICELHPEDFRNWLRGLKRGEIKPPHRVGEWNIILTLESLRPARLDGEMKKILIQEELDSFIKARASKIRSKQSLTPLNY